MATKETVTNGVQLGSQRALDRTTSWYAKDSTLIRPSHFFTTASLSPVPISEAVRIDIELISAIIRIPVGHQLRLVIATQPSELFRQYGPGVQLPNPLAPTPQQITNLVGGRYTILFGREAPSVISLSTSTDMDLISSAQDWGPPN